MKQFAEEQLDEIRRAVQFGREASKLRGNTTEIFSAAFISANGVQVPGEEISDDVKKQLESSIKKCLSDKRGPKFDYADPDRSFFRTVSREINRALSETYWASCSDHQNIVGFRLMVSDNAEDVERCRELARCNLYNLGPGIYPKDEIVVLQPCCDQAFFQVVFSDEIHQK